MTGKSKIRLLFLIPMLVAIVVTFTFLVLPDGNEPPPDKIGETITITATVETQVHYSRTVSEGIGISAEK